MITSTPLTVAPGKTRLFWFIFIYKEEFFFFFYNYVSLTRGLYYLAHLEDILIRSTQCMFAEVRSKCGEVFNKMQKMINLPLMLILICVLCHTHTHTHTQNPLKYADFLLQNEEASTMHTFMSHKYYKAWKLCDNYSSHIWLCSLNLSDVDKREDIFSEQDDVSALCAKYCAMDV